MDPRELAIILDLQNKMLEAGRTPEEIAMVFKELIAKSGVDVKGIAQVLLAVLEQGRVKGEEITASSFLFDAIMHPTGLDGAQCTIFFQPPGEPGSHQSFHQFSKVIC